MQEDNVVQLFPDGALDKTATLSRDFALHEVPDEGLVASTPEDDPGPTPEPDLAEEVRTLSAMMGEMRLQHLQLAGAVNGIIQGWNRLSERHDTLEEAFALMGRDLAQLTAMGQAIKNYSAQLKKARQSGKVIYLPEGGEVQLGQ